MKIFKIMSSGCGIGTGLIFGATAAVVPLASALISADTIVVYGVGQGGVANAVIANSSASYNSASAYGAYGGYNISGGNATAAVGDSSAAYMTGTVTSLTLAKGGVAPGGSSITTGGSAGATSIADNGLGAALAQAKAMGGIGGLPGAGGGYAASSASAYAKNGAATASVVSRK